MFSGATRSASHGDGRQWRRSHGSNGDMSLGNLACSASLAVGTAVRRTGQAGAEAATLASDTRAHPGTSAAMKHVAFRGPTSPAAFAGKGLAFAGVHAICRRVSLGEHDECRSGSHPALPDKLKLAAIASIAWRR